MATRRTPIVRRQRPRVPHPKPPPRGKRPPPAPTLVMPFGGSELSPLEGTLPERMVQSWLERHAVALGVTWSKQSSQLGGRNLPGGAVVDFQIETPARIYIRVQGNYWHRHDAGVIGKDYWQRLTLGAYGTVVDLWESAITVPGALDDLMLDALRGIERPPPESMFVAYRPPGV